MKEYGECKNCGGRIYYSVEDVCFIHDPITWGKNDWHTYFNDPINYNNGYWCDQERTKSGEMKNDKI